MTDRVLFAVNTPAALRPCRISGKARRSRVAVRDGPLTSSTQVSPYLAAPRFLPLILILFNHLPASPYCIYCSLLLAGAGRCGLTAYLRGYIPLLGSFALCLNKDGLFGFCHVRPAKRYGGDAAMT
jgi:hypothetical protein